MHYLRGGASPSSLVLGLESDDDKRKWTFESLAESIEIYIASGKHETAGDEPHALLAESAARRRIR